MPFHLLKKGKAPEEQFSFSCSLTFYRGSISVLVTPALLSSVHQHGGGLCSSSMKQDAVGLDSSFKKQAGDGSHSSFETLVASFISPPTRLGTHLRLTAYSGMTSLCLSGSRVIGFDFYLIILNSSSSSSYTSACISL